MRRHLLLSLAVSIVAALAFSPPATATPASGSGSSVRMQGPLGDPRIEEAVAACADAWASKAGIEGFGVVVDLLQQDNLAAMRGAIVALQDKVVRDTYNNFVQIPICAALVADLGLNPNQLDDCPTGESLSFNSDNESASCRSTDYSAFDVPGAFLGVWTGNITQQRPPIPPYTLKVQILQAKIGSTVASGFYTGDNCRFHWTLLSADTNRMVVNEIVHSGTCFNNIKITLTTSGDALNYDFENGNGRGMLNH